MENKYSYDFKISYKTDKIEKLVLSFELKPTIAQVKKALSEIKNRFREGSEYNLFNPIKGYIYYSVYGWTSTVNVILTEDKSEKFDRPQPDEPTGKYTRASKIIAL